jgi:hypothetical protein
MMFMTPSGTRFPKDTTVSRAVTKRVSTTEFGNDAVFGQRGAEGPGCQQSRSASRRGLTGSSHFDMYRWILRSISISLLYKYSNIWQAQSPTPLCRQRNGRHFLPWPSPYGRSRQERSSRHDDDLRTRQQIIRRQPRVCEGHGWTGRRDQK